MATLTLTSWHIDNEETGIVVASNANPKLRKPAFGDKYEGYFTYAVTGTTINNRTEIRFNPALFIRNGFKDSGNLDNGNETYSWVGTNLGATFQPMTFQGGVNALSTGLNETYEIRRLSVLTFEVKVTFYMTADTLAYFGAVTSGQYSRLTADIFSQNSTQIYNNTNQSIYTTNAGLDVWTLGLYCAVIFTQSPSPTVLISTGGVATPTSGFTINAILGSGIDFVADGWDNPCGTGATQVEITMYTQGTLAGNTVTFQATLVPASTTTTSLTFSSSVNFPVSFNGGAYVMDITAIDCGDSFTYGLLGEDNARVRQWDWLDIDGLFANDGIHTDRVFTLLRGATTVSTINTTNPTDIQFDFTYTGSDVTKGKFWMIPTNIGNDASQWWFDMLQRTPIQFTDTPLPVNIVGNDWRITQTIDPLALNLQNGETYHFLYVLYDSTDNYYASYVFQDVRVSNQIEIPTDGTYCLIPITGQMYTYKNTFATDYLNVSPLQRVAASVRYDKADYNACSNFNRVSRIEVTLERANGQILDSSLVVVNNGIGFSTDPRMGVVDNPAALNLTWKLRIEDAYTLQTLTVRWKMVSLTEPTETFFIQKFEVDDYQQNLLVADQDLIDIRFIDENGFILTDDDRNCDGGVITVETEKDPASPEYYQAAVWLDADLVVEEEEVWSGGGILPLSSNNFQSDVEENFNTSGSVDRVFHKITSGVNSGEVGMIGYPPPLPINIGRVMLHHTNPNGRNITFILNEDIPIGTKVMVTLGGYATSADFTFRIGNTSSSLNDANSVNWALYPSISYATFLGTLVPAGSWVRVEYNGSLTAHTDIATYLDYFSSFAPVYPRILAKTVIPSTRIAATDIMLYPSTTTTYLSVGTPSTIRYTEARTAAELVANSDLTDFQPGEFAWNSGLSTTAGHLYLEPATATGLTSVSIALSSLEPNIQLTTFATPLTNECYPNSGVGVNPPATQFDRINDTGTISNLAGRRYLDYQSVPIDSYYECCFTFQYNAAAGASTRVIQATKDINNFNSILIGSGNRVFLALQGINYYFLGTYNFIVGQVYNMYVRVRKRANVGTSAQLYYLDESFSCVNGRVDTTKSNTQLSTGVAIIDNTTTGVGFVGAASSGGCNETHACNRMSTCAVNHGVTPIMDLDDIRSFMLGDKTLLPSFGLYYNMEVIGVGGVIVNSGSDASVGSLQLNNNINTPLNLFI